jgi:hypothetical protein
MADPLSIAVGVVGLLQVATSLSARITEFVSSLRGIPSDLQELIDTQATSVSASSLT